MYINTWDVPPAGEPLSPEMPPTRMLKHVGLPPPAAPKHKVPIRSIRRVGPRIAKLSPYDPFIRPVLHAPRFPTPAYHTTNSHTILTISSLSHYSSSSSPSQYSSSSYASSLSSFDSVPKTPELENGEYFDIRIHTWSTVCGTKHKQDPINQPTNSPLKSRWSDPSLAEVPLTPSTELHAPILGRLGTWSRAHTPHPRVETEGSWSHRLRTCSSVLWRAVCVLLG
ncbi:hypothetical protein BDW22DRAFT_1230164 [Trametopsis cervina]|nr:hypothetical protein BDW22DRAFT_1230164 [Trametopsis cervina]